MKRIKGWKKGLAFTFSLALVAAPLTANAQVFSGGKLLSASAAEEVSENDAILAYLDELCKSKYEGYEDYKDLLFSEKALSVFQSGEDDYILTDALRGITAKGNTNGEHFMENKEYKSDWLYYYYFDELIVNEIKYVVTEDEYNAFLETQPKEPLQDTYEVSSAKEFEKAVNAVNSADDDVTRTIRLTADITDFSEILDGRGEKIYFRFNTKAVLDLNGSFFGNPTSDKPYLIFTSNTEEAELTITDSSVSGSGKMYVDNIQADEGRVYIDSGTFKADFIGVSYRFGGIMSITGGKFILDPSNSDYFSLYELDDSVSLGYETVKADTIGEEEIYEVRRADTDITTAEQIYEPILSAVKERLENGFSNYSDTDKPVSGAFTEPQDEVMQFSAMWYLPSGGFTSENTGYAIIDTDMDGREELIMGSINDDGSTTIFDIYTAFRNRAWHVAAANESDSFTLGEQEHILEQGSNGESDSFITSYFLYIDKLKTHIAYKTVDGITYEYTFVYSEESDDYVRAWEETDENPEDDEYLQYELMNVELTPFSEFKSASNERVLINATTKGNGQIAGSDDGSEPVFDDEYPFQQAVYNANKGTTIKLSAKADEGWTFKEWKNKQTRETYSTDASVTIEANEALELVAVFAADDAVEHTFTDDQLEIWAEKDYQDKTGAAVRAEITSWSDTEYEITLTDKDENTLDTYTIDPDTGKGKKSDGHRVNLPKTGMSGSHKAIAGLAALMGIAGIGLVKKSRKEDKE